MFALRSISARASGTVLGAAEGGLARACLAAFRVAEIQNSRTNANPQAPAPALAPEVEGLEELQQGRGAVHTALQEGRVVRLHLGV